MTLRKALAHSLNVATVKVAEMVGYERVADLWSKKLGIGAHIKPYPALALGSFEATPLEMATAYNVLANGGLKVEPVTVLRVTDDQGRTLEQPRSPQAAARGPRGVRVPGHEHDAQRAQRRHRGGAAEPRASPLDAAGKTGTTNDMRDAWFAGFTPDLLCVVWVGFDDNTPIGPLRRAGRAAHLGRVHEGRPGRQEGAALPRADGRSSSWTSTRRRACSPPRTARR